MFSKNGITLVAEGHVVVCKLSNRQLGDPVVLLIIDVDSEILFKDLVDLLSLTIRFQVICD